MKKIACLFLGILALCVCSCEPDTQVKYKNEDGAVVRGRTFEVNGHTYIEFYRMGGGYDNYTGFEHDPDCLLEDLKKLKKQGLL